MSHTRYELHEEHKKKQPLINSKTAEFKYYGAFSTPLPLFGDKSKYIDQINSEFSAFKGSSKLLALAAERKTLKTK